MAQVNKTKEETVRESMNSPKKIDTSVEFRMPRSSTLFDPKRHDCKCLCCGKGFTDSAKKNNFQKSPSPLFQENDGYLPWCKECSDKYYSLLCALYSQNEEHAIEHFCHIADWVYDPNPLLAARDFESSHHNRTRLSHYAAKKNLNCGGRKSFIDTIKHNYENRQEEIIESYEDVKDSKKTKLKTVKFFGTGFSDEDYEYLQDQYEDWTTRHECKTKAQEEVFKRICFKQLEILKATRAGENTKDLDYTYQQLLDTANLKPKQTNMDALAEDRTFGQLIKIWENEKPIPEPDPEFKDVDGIGRYMSVFFLGHLAKMVGIKNKFSRMYDEEMNKYTVTKPEYEEDTEALFDAIFGGHLESSNPKEDMDGE